MKSLSKDSLRKEVLENLNLRIRPTDEEVYREIDKIILKNSRFTYGSISKKQVLREQVFYAIRGFDILEKYLHDDTITEIMVVGASKIFVEKNGVIEKLEESFSSEDELYRLIDHIVSPINRMVNESSPIVDSRLPDGSRVHIVLPPVSLVGPVITIRKFPKEGMTMERLIDYGEFPGEMLPIFQCLIKGKYNILVSGATNSGKSSLLNAMAEYIPKSERIIVIEDSAELQFYHVDNLVRMETRNVNIEGKNEISMQDLIKASLRMRPDRIIVGEVRGAEAMSMLQALSTGHSGSFSTIHANSCRDALKRLETMVLMGVDIPLRAVQSQIASAVDILIHLGRLKNGQRKLLEMCEVCGYEEDYIINPLFSLEYEDKPPHLVDNHPIINDRKLISSGQFKLYEEAMEKFRRQKKAKKV